jgi:hypothetical protein
MSVRYPQDEFHPRQTTVPCKTCGKPTAMTGTKLCDGCWEVESRLESYVRNGGDNAKAILERAIEGKPVR